MLKYRNLEGTKFYRLTLIEGFNKDGVYRYNCKCDCGKVVSVRAYLLREDGKAKPTKSCGCYRSELSVERSLTHGSSKSSEYTSWVLMRDRCNNKNNKSYDNYGGRGISVCKRWDTFENFILDMGLKTNKNQTIDRIDNTKGYCAENCKWASKSEQALNKRVYKNNTTGCAGVHYDSASNKWRAQIRFEKKGHTIGRYNSIEEAIEARLKAEQEYYGRIIKR